jgi:hypothetical protein
MIPTIAQQLQAIKVRMEETIVPELPAEAKFAREQASFIVTTLDWLLATHEHAYRYEVVENDTYRKLIASMLDRVAGSEVDAVLLADARTALQESGPSPDEAVIPLRVVLAQNRRLKQAAMALYSAQTERHGSTSNPMRDLLATVALSQGQRELSFFRKTGWVKSDDDLGAVLGERVVHP